MAIHAALDAFWSGERPEQAPHTIYENEWRRVKDDPAWEAMYGDGLGVTCHRSSFEALRRDGLDSVESRCP